MINQQTQNKIIRKKVLWAEIKLHEQECKRIQQQIDGLRECQSYLITQVQRKLRESQEIAEWLDQKEYESNNT